MWILCNGVQIQRGENSHFLDTRVGYSEFGKFDCDMGIDQRELDTHEVFRDSYSMAKTKPDLVIHRAGLFGIHVHLGP